jgi:hypothetical protein
MQQWRPKHVAAGPYAPLMTAAMPAKWPALDRALRPQLFMQVLRQI